MRTFYFKSDDPALNVVENKLYEAGVAPSVSVSKVGITTWQASGKDIKAIKVACKENKLHWLNAKKTKAKLSLYMG